MNYRLPDGGRAAHALRPSTSARTATSRSSSASRAPARRRSARIRSGSSSATTSTAGATTASSTSRAAATPRPSACRHIYEPDIYSTTRRFGTILENVAIDPDTRELNLDSEEFTENTRGAFPLHFISNRPSTGMAGHPSTIIFLTADAFGVLPPDRQADARPGDVPLHQWLHGQAGRHRGWRQGADGDVLDVLRCAVHAAPPERLRRDARRAHGSHDVPVWLVNTGWTGGPVRRRASA